MEFTSMVRALVRWFSRNDSLIQDLPSQAEMQRMLLRERARADRAQTPLSVLVYSCGKDLQFVSPLVGVLRQRLRNTDEVGWLDTGRLCAVLPDTPAVGAWKVVDDVAQALPADLPLPGCTVYTYPDQQGGGLFSSLSPGRRESMGGDPDRTEEERLASALEPLLVQQMPRGKRLLDVLLSGLALVLLSPLLAVIALVIKATSRGPALFWQRRSGCGGRVFWMCKFRTMVVDAEVRKADLRAKSEQDGPAFKMRNDPRVTRIGRLLRVTSLDELPQLWNILRGDMSLVGPRPLPCDETGGCERWHRQRLLVTPGLTCIWQVHGRCRVSFADWMRMDVRYIRSRSLWQDVKLILQTIPAVLFQRGAH